MSLNEPGPRHISNFLNIDNIDSDPEFEDDRELEAEPEEIAVPGRQENEDPTPNPRSVIEGSSMVNQKRNSSMNTTLAAAKTAVQTTKRTPRKLDNRSQQLQQNQTADESRTRRRSRSVGHYDNHPLPELPIGAGGRQEDQSVEHTPVEVTTRIQALEEALTSAQIDVEEKENRIKECEAKVKTTEDYARKQEKLVKSHENQGLQILKDVNKVKEQCDQFRTERDKLKTERDRLFQEKGILRKEKDEAEVLGQRKDREAAEYKTMIARSSADNNLSDDQLESKFEALFNSLQGCVFKSFRGQTFKYHSLPEDTKNKMWKFMPRSEKLDQEWVKIVISIISQTLLELYEPRYYFGMSNEAPLGAAISIVADHVLVAGNPEAKAWLESTYRLLVASVPEKVETAKVDIVEAIVKEIESRLRGALVVKDAAMKDLRSIALSAFELFRLLHHHQSTYSIRLPPVYLGQRGGEQHFTKFSSQSMEEIPQSENTPERVQLEISVFPGLYKQVDGVNQNRDEIIVAYPKVMVRPQEPRVVYPNAPQGQSKWKFF